MAENIALFILKKMEQENLVKEENREEYIYAIITTIEKWSVIIGIMILGVIFQCAIPSLFFLIFFYSLRERTGGYHAKTYRRCFVYSMLVFLSVMYISSQIISVYYLLLITFIACTLIMWMGTINYSEIHMDNEELQNSKKLARYIVFIEFLFILALIYLNVYPLLYVYCCMAIIVCCISMILAKITKQEI